MRASILAAGLLAAAAAATPAAAQIFGSSPQYDQLGEARARGERLPLPAEAPQPQAVQMPAPVADLKPLSAPIGEQPVLGDYSAADYSVERDWAQAEDGTRIPITLIRRRDAAQPAACQRHVSPRFSLRKTRPRPSTTTSTRGSSGLTARAATSPFRGRRTQLAPPSMLLNNPASVPA